MRIALLVLAILLMSASTASAQEQAQQRKPAQKSPAQAVQKGPSKGPAQRAGRGRILRRDRQWRVLPWRRA